VSLGGGIGACSRPGPAEAPSGCRDDGECGAGTYCARDGQCHPDRHRPLAREPCPAGPSISNFRSGRVCTRSDDRQEVCEEAVDIVIDGSDRCEYDHETVRCNWFGYEFDYSGMDPEVPIVCEWERSMPADEGNREGVRQRDATRGTSELRLPEKSGHFISPGFQNHATPTGGARVVVTAEFDCSYAGLPLFEVGYRLHFGP
jgi:hypothetical protein